MKNFITLKNLKIAHRGLFDNEKIPENSLPAFEKALNKNYPIELDVRLTKDKVLIVFHDSTLNRLTKSKELVKNLTYEKIKKYNLLNTNEKIPTLQEVLKLINSQVLLDIEVKNTDNIEETCKILIKNLQNYSGNYIIKSFNPKILRWFKNNYPQIQRGLLISDKYENKFYKYLLTSKFIIHYCKPNFLAVSKNIIEKNKIQKFRKKCPLFIWTLENVNEFEKYKSLADTYICNNLPYYK